MKEQPESNRDEQFYLAWKDAVREGTPEDIARAERALNRVLLRYARAIVLNFFHRDRRDVCVDIVTRALIREPQFRGDSKFTTWFHRLAQNICTDIFRHEQSLREIGYGDGLPGAVYPTDADILLDQILRSVTPVERLLICGKIAGLTDEELTKETGLNLVTVKNRWRRLRTRLLEEHEGLLRPLKGGNSRASTPTTQPG